jgi:hypothetical protein
LEVGAGSFKNKTLPFRERNEVSCERRRRVVAVPVVVEPVVVRHHTAVVPVAVPDIQVAVGRVAETCKVSPMSLPIEILSGLYRIRHLKCHDTLHQVTSFFVEVSTYTTLSETVIADNLDVWILDSVSGNLDLRYMLPITIH